MKRTGEASRSQNRRLPALLAVAAAAVVASVALTASAPAAAQTTDRAKQRQLAPSGAFPQTPQAFFPTTPPAFFPQTPQAFFAPNNVGTTNRQRPAQSIAPFQPALPANRYIAPPSYQYYVTPYGIVSYPAYPVYPYGNSGIILYR